MVFSYNWLKDYVKRLPKPEKLAELLTLHSFEVKEVKKAGKDWVLDIDVLPDRASDCFSHMGIARECAALLKSKILIPKSQIRENKNIKTKDFVSAEVENKEFCQRYTARIITDVKVDVSPKWLQERLKVCNLKPINNIVDIANYVMLETGQPIHAFDFEKLSPTNYELKRITNKKMIVRFAKKEEKITTLDNEKYDLDENILIIADLKKPLAIAGIKGGKKAEIDKETKIVVLESANFDPRIIRRGSKLINLKTDASWRFEHGIDPNLTEMAINGAAGLIQEIAGGKICQGLIDFYPKKIFPKGINLDLDYLERLLGVKISRKEIKNILKRLGFKCNEKSSCYIIVEVPTFRLDISLPEDLIEEIGRMYDYQKIPSSFPLVALAPSERNLDVFWENNVKYILRSLGFSEVYNYSFLSEKEAKIFGYSEKELLEIENPISAEFKYLRPSLIPKLLKNISQNQKYFSEIKIFELGNIFQPPKSENRILIGVITGDAFYEAKGVVDLLLNKLGIANIWYDEYPNELKKSKTFWLHPQKCAEIKVDHQKIGLLGEISLRIQEELGIKTKVVIFDIDFEKLIKLASEEQEYRPISRYPAAVRDIAVLVPPEVGVEEVLNKIETAGEELLRDVDLFDIYEGEELPEGKKNLAFHLIYQAKDRTLTSKEIDQIQQKIIKALEEEAEWEVRR